MTDSRAALSIAQVNSEMGFSGGEVQMFLMMEGLRARGHRSLVICQPASSAAAEARRRGFDTVPVGMRNDFHLAAAWRMARSLRRCRIDLVHLHTGRANWLGGLAARMASLPAVTTRRMDRTVGRGWRTRLVYERLTECAVAISPAVADCLRRGGVAAERIRLIPEAVDPERVRVRTGRDEARRQMGAHGSEVVLLCLAALVRRKGLDVLLDAMALLEKAGILPRLCIAGEGPERDTLQRQALRLGLAARVQFMGRRDDPGDLLAGCDVFVLPSRREGLGVSALEAMAAGRPVVCSDVGGLAYSVVPGRTGLLVPPQQPDALATVLGRLCRDAPLRERLGKAGPGRVKEGFFAEQMVDAYESLYRAVVAERQQGY